MVETKTTETKKISKRAKWAKIKKELLKLPGKWPEIILISIDTKLDGIIIVTEPVSITYEDRLWNFGRNLRYKYDFPFENFEIYNLSKYEKGTLPDYFLVPGCQKIYERPGYGK